MTMSLCGNYLIREEADPCCWTGGSCVGVCMRGNHLARVGVDGSDVLRPLVSLQYDLLHVDPDLLHASAPKLDVDKLQEF